MALITFTSDFGNSDHYVAAVKAKILAFNSNLHIIDITHNIEHFNIAHGSFVVSSVFRDFPKGTVHIVAVNTNGGGNGQSIVMKLEDHFFIGSNNGMFGMFSNEPAMVFELNNFNSSETTFPARDIFAPAAARIASGGSMHDVGMQAVELKTLLARQPRTTKKQISGHVVRVDNYGNLITNISITDFIILSKDKKYKVLFGRESSTIIHENYNRVDPGDCFVVFNSLGLLEIGINHGNASELLGLNYDSGVNIIFEEN